MRKIPVLTHPIVGGKIALGSDVNGYGIGVFSQIINSTEKINGYYNHFLPKPERKYFVIRRELLVVVECIKH